MTFILKIYNRKRDINQLQSENILQVKKKIEIIYKF